MYKKYIDKHTVKDVPQNGVIAIDIVNEKGETVEVRTGVSNLPTAFEYDETTANKNGYYRYFEDPQPEYDEATQYLTHEYEFKRKKITKKWVVNDIPANVTDGE